MSAILSLSSSTHRPSLLAPHHRASYPCPAVPVSGHPRGSQESDMLDADFRESVFYVLRWIDLSGSSHTVMTTFPRACPSSKYRRASGTSLSGYVLSMTG